MTGIANIVTIIIIIVIIVIIVITLLKYIPPTNEKVNEKFTLASDNTITFSKADIDAIKKILSHKVPSLNDAQLQSIVEEDLSAYNKGFVDQIKQRLVDITILKNYLNMVNAQAYPIGLNSLFYYQNHDDELAMNAKTIGMNQIEADTMTLQDKLTKLFSAPTVSQEYNNFLYAGKQAASILTGGTPTFS